MHVRSWHASKSVLHCSNDMIAAVKEHTLFSNVETISVVRLYAKDTAKVIQGLIFILQ